MLCAGCARAITLDFSTEKRLKTAGSTLEQQIPAFSLSSRRMKSAALLSAALAGSASAVQVFFDNTKPRLDNTGAIMDSHDSSVHKYPNNPGCVRE